jgi:hypothetical protein
MSHANNLERSLGGRFEQLTTLLINYGALWRPVPFHLLELPWEAHYPVLTAALEALDEQALAMLERDHNALLDWLCLHIPELAAIREIDSMPALPPKRHEYPRGFERDIPGRKWQQVTAFTACVEALDGPVLEWCASKAHLGRALCQRFGTPVTALEWRPDLCDAANEKSRQLQLDVQAEPCDVMSADAIDYVGRSHHVVALHACGDLHRRLIETIAAHRLQSLHLSPCCYHLSANAHYQPLSRAAINSGLTLSRDDCRLAVQETVTAPAVTTQRREKKNAWRLGFDAMQRQLRGVDNYLPLPPLPDAIFAGSFADFCRHAAGLKSIALPSRVDWQCFEQQGWQRQARVSRMELPRHGFRRALELWLVLDRALYLEQRGYQVTVGTFCERHLTPRNLMIRATLIRGQHPGSSPLNSPDSANSHPSRTPPV